MRNVPKKLGSKQLPKSHLRCKQSRRHFSVNFTMCLSVSHFTQWAPPTEITRNDRTGRQWKAIVYFLAKKEWRHITRFRTIFVDAGCGWSRLLSISIPPSLLSFYTAGFWSLAMSGYYCRSEDVSPFLLASPARIKRSFTFSSQGRIQDFFGEGVHSSLALLQHQ